MTIWTLETIEWGRFDASKVDPEILRNIKAAAMVERNGGDYGIYLGRVFADDPPFVEDVTRWVREEIQHGMALGRWAQLADRERLAQEELTDASTDAEKAAAQKALAVAKDLRRAQAYYASR